MSLSKFAAHRRGFTLIELLIVIVVIAILALIVIPKLLTANRKAKEATLVSNLRQVRSAVETFYADTGYYPATLTVLTKSVLDGYTDLAAATSGASYSSYRGPWLRVDGGVQELPKNPFADKTLDTVAQHWDFDNTTGKVLPNTTDVNYPGGATLIDGTALSTL